MAEKVIKGQKARKKLISLRGGFLHRIAENGRVNLPSNFKEALINRGVSRLIIIREPDCLRVWPEDEWEKKEQAFQTLNLEDSKVSAYLRHLYSNLMDLEIDQSGRFVISEPLKKEMEFKDEVFILGLGNLFEIWNPDAYKWKAKELAQEFALNRSYVVELLEKRKQDEGS